MPKKLEAMTVDELDGETIRLKGEQPARVKDKLREVKAVRDTKVHVERTRDRLKKILTTVSGRTPEDVDTFLATKSVDEMMALIKPFEDIEAQVGVVVTVGPADVVELKGQ